MISNENLQNSLKISIIVGTLLSLINHYQIIYYKEIMDFRLIFQILLNYLIPFLVASLSVYHYKK